MYVRTSDKDRSEKLIVSTLCSGELKMNNKYENSFYIFVHCLLHFTLNKQHTRTKYLQFFNNESIYSQTCINNSKPGQSGYCMVVIICGGLSIYFHSPANSIPLDFTAYQTFTASIRQL